MVVVTKTSVWRINVDHTPFPITKTYIIVEGNIPGYLRGLLPMLRGKTVKEVGSLVEKNFTTLMEELKAELMKEPITQQHLDKWNIENTIMFKV